MLQFFTILVAIDIAPLPRKHLLKTGQYEVGALDITCSTPEKHDCLKQIQGTIDFYLPLLFPNGEPVPNKPSSSIQKLNIIITTQSLPIDFKSANETYRVEVDSNGINIYAENQFGVARALATVSQMVESKYEIGKYQIQEQSVEDWPEFPYRAVMIDTSRHFLPLQALKRQVAALSVSKMSVLHIHESDSQSFPLQTDTAPGSNFAKGAYKVNGEAYIHTLKQYKELAEYAKDLGIFIMLELDMPGHAESWKHSGDSITCQCGDVIDPTNELTYKYIETYLEDVFNTLYKPYGFNGMIHLGGDEVNSWCLSQDPKVKKYMQDNNLNEQKIQQMLHNRVMEILENISKRMYPARNGTNYRFYWQEAYSNGNNFSNGGVVHSWMSSWVIREAVNKKNFVIRSQGWYLDLNQPGGNQENFVDSWKDFYGVDPADGVTDATQRKNYILGGGGCQWGEKVNNGNIDEQIWPRSIAISEVLWSYPSARQITHQVKQRLNSLTCKIRQAGTQSGAIIPSVPCPGVDNEIGNEKLEYWRKDNIEQGLVFN